VCEIHCRATIFIHIRLFTRIRRGVSYLLTPSPAPRLFTPLPCFLFLRDRALRRCPGVRLYVDLEPTLEEMDQESGVSESDSSTEIDSSDEEMGVENRAFCECMRLYGKEIGAFITSSFGGSISCACALCRLYCTMYCLAPIGSALWRMGRGEVKTRLLEFKKSPPDFMFYFFSRHALGIEGEQPGSDSIQFFQIEGMHHLPI
jgi:hypothetical protein